MALANQAVKMGMKTRLKNAVTRGTDVIPSNTDANRYMLTRPFKDNALGGQDVIQKQVLGARDRYKNPHMYDDRKTAFTAKQKELAEYDEVMKGVPTGDPTRAGMQEGRAEIVSEMNRIKGSRRDTDPGLWKTTKEMTGGVWNAMNTGSAAQVATKWGAVGAGYMALNGMGRAVSGGGATYDSSGKRDIMGVPFV